MKKHLALVLPVLAIYLAILVFFHPRVFTYRFDHEIVDRYFCSQDIPYEPPCPRVWLSDEELHIAAGYLYAKGHDPAVIDFQHMPFVATLYGFSIVLFNNPFYVEILFGMLYLTLVYILGMKLFKSRLIAIFGSSLFLIDPLFLDLSSQASYELGQAVFLLSYLILMVFYRKKFVLQGIVLGLLCSTKFWGAALFFIAATVAYRVVKREFDIKIYIQHLAVAFVAFSLTYITSFVKQNFLFNIVFFQLKVLKFWLDHSVSNIPFASFILFTTGYFKSWWEGHEILRTQIWFFLWPVGLISSIILSVKPLLKWNISPILFFSSIPLIYLVYLGVQAPFSRYFILILPFCYLSLSYLVITFGEKYVWKTAIKNGKKK